MRTLTSTLTAAAKAPARSPYVRVRAQRKIGAVGRLDWERLYTGVETEAYTALAQAGDGSIVRARAGATDTKVQRITSPGSGSAWSTWDSLTGIPAVIALGASGSTVWLATVDGGTGQVFVRRSTDYGATWSAGDVLTGAGAVPGHIAVAVKDADTALIVYNRGTTLYSLKRTGAGWAAEAAGPSTFASISGLAMQYSGDFNLIITGTAVTTLDPTVWIDIYGDGYSYTADTWGDLYVVQSASAGSGVSFVYPALAMADVFRVSFREAFSGTTAYDRPYLTHSLPTSDFVNTWWREPVPFNLEPALFGLRLAFTTGDYVYASTLAGVWRAPLVTGNGLDLSSAVTELKSSVGGQTEGRATIHLDNSSGTYASPGAGALLELQRGSQITIDPGYNTTDGAEASALSPPFWIESLAYTHAKGKAELVIEAFDAWGLLARWRARSQVTWAASADNIAGILSWILARVGLKLTLGGSNSSALSNQYPAFTIHPGESAASAARRALDLIPDRFVFKGPTGTLIQPVSSTASGYSYGTTHPILEARYSLGNMDQNHVQVRDATRFSESFSWADIGLAYNRTAQVRDINLASAAEGLARADAELRDATIAARSDAITVPAHAGQELLDMIDVTDATAGLSAAKRRVIAMQLQYSTTKALYQHTLTLGDP